MKSIGIMQPFYRNSAVLSEKVFNGGLEPGGELMRVPPYLLDETIDFPYLNRKPADKELLFTDHITLVRFLGGIGDDIIHCEEEKGGELDLVYRDESGKIRVRRELVERYRPYVELYGREVTVVLDNIPWAFVHDAEIDGYGQINPPGDDREWTGFMRDMCRTLIDCFGFETVNAWRFRLNTEGRIKLDTVGYCRHYDLTTQAVRELLPGARFGPYNIAGIAGMPNQAIHMHAFARHCAEGTNLATGEKGSPFDFASVSYYSMPRTEWNGILSRASVSPTERTVKEYLPYWDKISSMSETFGSIKREIHELGILSNEYDRLTSEPGARGAAWLFQLLFGMREHAGLDKSWHWHTTDVVAASGKAWDDCRRILRSNGWLYAVLDHMAGLDTYMLDAEAAHPCTEEVSFKAAGFFGERNFIILSGFNLNRHLIYDGYVQVDIPAERIKPGIDTGWRWTQLSDGNDVYQAIRGDLQAAGQVSNELPRRFKLNQNETYKSAFHEEHVAVLPGAMYPVFAAWDRYMASQEGMDAIDRNWGKYEEMIKESLRLKPWKPAFYEHDGFTRLYVPMRTPMTAVIEIGGGKGGPG